MPESVTPWCTVAEAMMSLHARAQVPCVAPPLGVVTAVVFEADDVGSR